MESLKAQNNSKSVVLQERKAAEAMPKKAVRKLFFSTTGQCEFSEKVVTAEDAVENYQDVHSIGQKETRFMAMPPQGKHLPNHDAVKSRRDFVQKPFLDLNENRQLAKIFQGSQPKMPGHESEKTTKYTRDFKRPSPEQMRRAKAAAVAFGDLEGDSSRTLGGKGDWMVAKSSAHDHFSKPPQLIKPSKYDLVNCLEVGDAEATSWKTNYHRSYKQPPGTVPLPGGAARHQRPGRVPPRDVDVLMREFKKGMQHSFTAPGPLVLKKPF
mmetsp:Transcript_12975/g.29509  ORF Transcript_12975/g.29509 Transcript_12975/m.29509 type:complete len:268 (-) Transcript_12975:94-897(-)